ncbi:hypothetical protein GALMADRAFT_67117, partial [Galerina marginata CBS 339.88]
MDNIFAIFFSRIRQIWTSFKLNSISLDEDIANTSSCLSSFPFAEHLSSNYIPSDTETLLIKALLVQPSVTLQKIKDEMFRLNKRIEYLARKHEDLAHQLVTCGSLVTLPRRLPDDILREIFHHSLPTNCNPCLETQSPPLVFMQVCIRWRQLVISTPTLW